MNLPPKVTERAFSRLSEIKASAQGQALRVAVEGGGCSGFQYEIKLDTAQDDDLVLGSLESYLIQSIPRVEKGKESSVNLPLQFDPGSRG